MAEQQNKSDISEIELSGDLATLAEICKNAADGDGEALDPLKLEDGIAIKPWFVSTENTENRREEMEQGIEDCVYNIEASERLGMHHAAHVYHLNLALIRQIFKTTFNEHPTELVLKIVAQTMHDLCMDTSASLEKISSLAREGEVDVEREPNEEPLPRRPITAFRSYMSHIEEDGEESLAKSTGPRTPSSKASPRGPFKTDEDVGQISEQTGG